MKRILLSAFLFSFLFLSSCDDDVVDALPSRFVYYADASGTLQRYDITLKKIEAPGHAGIVRFSAVGANGIVLFEAEDGGQRTLYGRCENGSIIPVPMPVSPDASEEYRYAAAAPALSAEGHHAVYAVYRKKKSEADSATWTQELCRYNCAEMNMEQVDLTSYVRAQFAGSAYEVEIVRVEQLLLSRDGGRAVIAVAVTDLKPDGSRDTQHLLMTWDASLHLLQGMRDQPRLFTFDPLCRSLYYEAGGSYRAVDCDGGTVSHATVTSDRPALLTPHAFAARTGEYISHSIGGDILTLVRITDGARTTVLANIREITVAFPEITFGTLGTWASVSPDGAWVAFPWIDGEEEHLFIIRRDGTDLRRIAHGSYPVQAVVSDEIPF